MTLGTPGLRSLSSLFLAIVVLSAWVPYAHAQQVGIQVQPAMIEERVEPGQTYPFTLRVTNLGRQADTFYLSLRDIAGVGEGGHPIFRDAKQEKTGFEASTWISLAQESITIPAGEARSVTLDIAVPPEAFRGGYFASIVVTTNPPPMEEGGAVVAYGASTIVALRVGGSAGEAIEEVQIREFRTDKRLYGKPEVAFAVKVGNEGNVLVRPRGPLEITDMFGKKVASLLVNPEGGAILPRADRTFAAEWQGEGLHFGRYQVVVSLSFGDEGIQTVSETLSFWVLPSSILIPTLVILLVTIGGLFLLTKLHIRRKLTEMNLEARPVRAHRGKEGPISPVMLSVAVVLVCALVFFLVLFIFFA